MSNANGVTATIADAAESVKDKAVEIAEAAADKAGAAVASAKKAATKIGVRIWRVFQVNWVCICWRRSFFSTLPAAFRGRLSICTKWRGTL